MAVNTTQGSKKDFVGGIKKKVGGIKEIVGGIKEKVGGHEQAIGGIKQAPLMPPNGQVALTHMALFTGKVAGGIRTA